MCKCTPEIRTPFCGKPGCQWPTIEHKPTKAQVSQIKYKNRMYAEGYAAGHLDGAEKMREKAASVCHEYETRMVTAAHERKNAGKPYSVAECKADAGASLKEIIRALTTEDLT